MPGWDYRIDLVEEWKQAKANEITAYQLAQKVANKLNICPARVPNSVKAAFSEMPEEADFDDFDEALSDLYDWADSYRVWIATF